MTRADLIAAVAERLNGCSKKEAAEIVDAIIESMARTLESGEDMKVSGFGKFVVRDKWARPGRNPQTGERITISARRVVTFKVSPLLKAEMNGSREEGPGGAADVALRS